MWGRGVRVEAAGELGCCLRKCSGPGPGAVRIERVSTGEVVAELMAVGAGVDPASAEAKVLGSIAVAGVFPEKVDVDVMAYLGEARRCTRGEGNSRRE